MAGKEHDVPREPCSQGGVGGESPEEALCQLFQKPGIWIERKGEPKNFKQKKTELELKG